MTLLDQSREIARLMAAEEVRVVLAESCTAGLVSATLARVPGISAYLCGSAVTYRNRTKKDWLGISSSLLADPGPVSELAARQMAQGVLRLTPEADIALSVTGHLGPNAPREFDGLVYVGWARRDERGRPGRNDVRRHRLKTRGRYARQQETVRHVLTQLRQLLKKP